MKSAPTQQEVKSLISLIIPYGRGTEIAHDLGITKGDWSRRASVTDGRKLATAEALREQCAIIRNCPAEWPAIREYIESLWDEWETQGRLPVPTDAQIAKEQHDYVDAVLKGAPPARKGMELAQSIACSKRKLAYIESVPADGDVGIRKVG